MPSYTHMVLLKVRSEVTPESLAHLFEEIKGLCENKLVKGLISYSGGPYDSPEGLNKGYTHGFSMVFEDEKSRNDYFPHPEHQRVVAILLPLVEDVLAFDYAY